MPLTYHTSPEVSAKSTLTHLSSRCSPIWPGEPASNTTSLTPSSLVLRMIYISFCLSPLSDSFHWFHVLDSLRASSGQVLYSLPYDSQEL